MGEDGEVSERASAGDFIKYVKNLQRKLDFLDEIVQKQHEEKANG